MGRAACTEPQFLYKGDLYLFYLTLYNNVYFITVECQTETQLGMRAYWCIAWHKVQPFNLVFEFGFHGSVHHVDCSKYNQRDAVQQVFYCSLVGSTCFGCRRHPSSGAQYVQSRSVGTMCVW